MGWGAQTSPLLLHLLTPLGFPWDTLWPEALLEVCPCSLGKRDHRAGVLSAGLPLAHTWPQSRAHGCLLSTRQQTENVSQESKERGPGSE